MSLKYVQTNTLFQAGSGNTIGAISIVLTAITDIYGNVLTMTDFGTKGYGSCEPDTSNEEAFTFTGITANGNGTYSLTGVSTALAKSPYTETSGLIRQHAGGTKVVITDNVAWWNTFANKNNDEVITGRWGSSVAPLGNTDYANKLYVDNTVSTGVADASTTVKGATKLDTAPTLATSPIAVGVNSLLVAPATGTSGGIMGWTSTTVRASSVLLTNHALIVGGGAGATPTPVASLGTSTQVLHGAAAGDPTWGAVVLTTDVSGVLPLANGGTGSSTGLTCTNGVAASTGTSTTVTVTHGLGRVPITIDIHGVGNRTGTGDCSVSWGGYAGASNKCVYNDGSSGGAGQTSSSFSVFMSAIGSAGNYTTGVIGNINSTTFDIVFTNSGSGSTTSAAYYWKAQ